MTNEAFLSAPRAREAGAPPTSIANVITACTEGYPFPTSLDLDQPVGGLAPPTQAQLLGQAVADDWTLPRLEAALGAWARRPT